MHCREFINTIYEYNVRECRSIDSDSASIHFRNCASCRNYLASYQRTIALIRRVFKNENRLVTVSRRWCREMVSVAQSHGLIQPP